MGRVTLSVNVLLLLVAGIVFTGVSTAGAQPFSLQVGPPTAASPQPGSRERKVLTGVLAVRPIGCPNAASVTISATAEGFDAGARRSVPLELTVTSVPGVRLVSRTWTGGPWVLRIVGQCAGATAGAIVTLAPSGAYERAGVEYVAGAPTPAQVDRALQALTSGPRPAAAWQ